jgi:hypothetical protein
MVKDLHALCQVGRRSVRQMYIHTTLDVDPGTPQEPNRCRVLFQATGFDQARKGRVSLFHAVAWVC